MEQETNNKDNKGCAIAVGICVIISIVYFFFTTSKEEIADTGAFLLLIAFMVGAYFGIKAYLNYTSDTDNKFVRIGVLIGIFISLMLLLGAIMNSFNTMIVVGTIGSVAFCVLIGIWMYNSYKD